jgi:oxygen-dependent protoporphyrinogen oxidase
MTGRVVVIGAGITGLTAATRLAADGVDVVVLESDTEAGGKVRSADVDGVRLEAGPDSLLARKPWAVDLARELGMGDDLAPAAPAATHIWTRAGLLRFPSGPFGISTDPLELWRWKGMSYLGKLRAAGDLLLPRGRPGTDESLGSLLRRRIGDEATDRLVAPLLGGLFAGDVDRLSVEATFPELGQWEREHRSLMRGARAMSASRRPASVSRPEGGRRAVPPPMFMRLRGGLRRLTDALAADLGDRLRTSTVATGMEPDGDSFTVSTADEDLKADAVVITTPTFVAADLVAEMTPGAVEHLRALTYVSTAVALLVYEDGTNERLPDSSGFVAPRGVLPMNAATIVSKKWPDPAFGGRAVLRCFVGGAGTEELLDREDGTILEEVTSALADIFPLPASPAASTLIRWPRAMPQYDVGHLQRVAAIEEALPAGVVVAGQAYRGAGLPDCVRQGGEAAARVRARLSEAGAA